MYFTPSLIAKNVDDQNTNLNKVPIIHKNI
jgi:hypothetical protein